MEKTIIVKRKIEAIQIMEVKPEKGKTIDDLIDNGDYKTVSFDIMEVLSENWIE